MVIPASHSLEKGERLKTELMMMMATWRSLHKYPNSTAFGELLGWQTREVLGDRLTRRGQEVPRPFPRVSSDTFLPSRCSSTCFVICFYDELVNVNKCLPGFWEPVWQTIKPKEALISRQSIRSTGDHLHLWLASEVGGVHRVGLSPSLGNRTLNPGR